MDSLSWYLQQQQQLQVPGDAAPSDCPGAAPRINNK
tara:strand:- start:581 stop:688 length:108 start_codon:yes stop_codon:yes gene_type:complete